MAMRGNVLIAQGGGPTAVINQSLIGVINECKKFREIEKIYGAIHGIDGILNEEFVDLSQETSINLENIANTPSSALLSTRRKASHETCVEMFKVLSAHNIKYFFYIGGNDSSETLEIILQESKKANYDLRCIHIPKTIDNDLVLNDHTPGFGSAARFVSQGFVGINLDNKSLGGVYIGIVMGRHAGFLTASSVLGKKYEDDGPHLVYLPERDFSIETFVNDVKDVYSKYGRCIVAISEGVCDSEGTPIAVKYCKEIERDSHGNLQLSGNGLLGDLLAHYIKNGLGIKRVRVDTFGYLQRSFIESVSDIDRMEAREIGEKAVQYAVIHDMNGSVAIKRIGDYDIEYRLEKLHLIAGKTKTMDESFINRDGNYVTEAFLKYCKPLIGRSLKEPYILRAPKVEKILAKK